jgi:hypothetical protein
MSKRTRIGNRYVTRNKDGQFKTNVSVGRSLSADRRRKSKNTVKAGRGHQGDIKRAEGHGCGCTSGCVKCADTFGAESRFDKLANKVAKDYESKGYSDKEAMEIGKRVAYSQGVKKYGKAGMTRLSKEGRKKSMKKSADSYSLNAESGQVNNMSWENSEPYATLEGYNPVDSVIASPPLGRGVAQDFGAEYHDMESQGYDDKMDESLGMRHRGRHSQSMKDRRDEASAMDKRHSKKHRKYDDVETMDLRTEYDSPYGPRQTTDFGMVGMGNDFAQNRAETFGAEGGSEFMTGARYGAGAVIGITGATIILGTVMNLFMRR